MPTQKHTILLAISKGHHTPEAIAAASSGVSVTQIHNYTNHLISHGFTVRTSPGRNATYDITDYGLAYLRGEHAHGATATHAAPPPPSVSDDGYRNIFKRPMLVAPVMTSFRPGANNAMSIASHGMPV